MLNKWEIVGLVNRAISQISDVDLRERLQEKMVDPTRQRRTWEWGARFGGRTEWEVGDYPVWIVALVCDREVGLAYAEGGFGANGYPWGLVFVADRNTGVPNSWYRSLEECAKDSGYFE